MVTIRFAGVSDARAIATVHVASWKVIYQGHIPEKILENLSVDDRENLWTSLLHDNVKVLVLEEQEQIIGFASFGSGRDQDIDSSSVAEITAIYLNPDKWRKGFGKLLLGAAIEEIKNNGYRNVCLWVLDSNLQARNFYENSGFTNRSEVKLEQKNGYTLREIRYWKTIK
jgi:L-amino acid N-acyltransferase YncA